MALVLGSHVQFEAEKIYVVSCSRYKHLRGFGYQQHATPEPPRALFMYARSVECLAREIVRWVGSHLAPAHSAGVVRPCSEIQIYPCKR
jgi:hypothetical protein